MDDEKMAELAEQAARDARATALESLSDEGVPAEIIDLALSVAVESGQRITAIKKGTSKTHGPATKLPDLTALNDWYFRRLSGKPRRGDPEFTTHVEDGWYFIVAGNPVLVEECLKRRGYAGAAAGSPTACFVGRSGLEKWVEKLD